MRAGLWWTSEGVRQESNASKSRATCSVRSDARSPFVASERSVRSDALCSERSFLLLVVSPGAPSSEHCYY